MIFWMTVLHLVTSCANAQMNILICIVLNTHFVAACEQECVVRLEAVANSAMAMLLCRTHICEYARAISIKTVSR